MYCERCGLPATGTDIDGLNACDTCRFNPQPVDQLFDPLTGYRISRPPAGYYDTNDMLAGYAPDPALP